MWIKNKILIQRYELFSKRQNFLAKIFGKIAKFFRFFAIFNFATIKNAAILTDYGIKIIHN